MKSIFFDDDGINVTDETLTVDSRVFDEKNDFIRCNRNFPMGSDYLEDEE